MGGHLLAVLLGELLQGLLGHGQHAARAAGAVVEQVGARFDLVGDRQEDQLGHELHGVARCPVFARLLVVLLVEAADELLEDRAHRVVVEAGVLHRAVAVQHGVGAQVDVRREELLDERAERVGFGEPRDLVAELEVVQDVLDVGREAVEVGLEVGLELLLAGAGLEVAQRELRGVVERLARRLPERPVLVDDARLVERGLHGEHGLLGRLEQGVEAPQHRHGQDDVAVLAADIQVAQHVVGDAPDEVDDPAQLGWFHRSPLPHTKQPGDAKEEAASDESAGCPGSSSAISSGEYIAAGQAGSDGGGRIRGDAKAEWPRTVRPSSPPRRPRPGLRRERPGIGCLPPVLRRSGLGMGRGAPRTGRFDGGDSALAYQWAAPAH